MASKRIVHIGVGSWGQNYLKAYPDFPVSVSVATRDSWRSMIEARPDGVVICTPPDTHVEIARFALERGIPVMVEKPLALSVREAAPLLGYGDNILVDHTYLFSSGIQALRTVLAGKHIFRIDTVGTGVKRHASYSVLWDYGPHDFSLVLYLLQEAPQEVLAEEAMSPFGPAYTVTLLFPSGAEAHCHFGIGEKRERKVSVAHDAGQSDFADNGKENPGPLHNAIAAFIGMLEGAHDHRAGLVIPMQVLKVLEACELSLSTGMSVQY